MTTGTPRTANPSGWDPRRRSALYLGIALAGLLVVLLRQLVPYLNYWATTDFAARMVMNLEALLGITHLAGAVWGGWRAYRGLVPSFGKSYGEPSYSVVIKVSDPRRGTTETTFLETFRDREQAEQYARRHPGSEVSYNAPPWFAYLMSLIGRALLGALLWIPLEILLQSRNLIAGPRSGGASGEPAGWGDYGVVPVVGLGVVVSIAAMVLFAIPISRTQSRLTPKLTDVEWGPYRSILRPGTVLTGRFLDQAPPERLQLTLFADPNSGFQEGAQTWSLQGELKSLDQPDRTRVFHVGVKPLFPEPIDFSGIYTARPDAPPVTGRDLVFSKEHYCYYLARLTADGELELTSPRGAAPGIRLSLAEQTP